MFYCPTCSKKFADESDLTKHFLACWKEQHPNHHSNPAPRSDDIVRTTIDDGVSDFFASFAERTSK